MWIHTLIADSQAFQRIRYALSMDPALRNTISVWPVSSWGELVLEAKKRTADLAIVQPDYPCLSGSTLDGPQFLARLNAKLGPGRLIPFICGPSPRPGISRALASVYPSIVLVKEIDDHPQAVLRAVSRVWVLRYTYPLLGQWGEDLRDLVLQLVVGWPPPESVGEVGRRLGLSTRTVRRWLWERSAPSPRDLFRWGRLLEAVALWRIGVRSRKRMAAILDVGGPDTLAGWSRDVAGLPLGKLLESSQGDELLPGHLSRTLLSTVPESESGRPLRRRPG